MMNLKVCFDYFSDWFRCCRPDGSDLFLISSPLLHIFDQTMSMLPFATRTYMVDALKMSDNRLICMPAARLLIAINTLKPNHECNRTE